MEKPTNTTNKGVSVKKTTHNNKEKKMEKDIEEGFYETQESF